ncbi:MAG: hypothetical protein ACRC10_10670 [Thermoguttaceae bacterium]
MSEQTVEQVNVATEQPGSAPSFWAGWKPRLLLVFCFHLIPVLLIAGFVYFGDFVYGLADERAFIWFLFPLMEFPTTWLAYPIAVIAPCFLGDYTIIGVVVGPSIVFQILGTLHWFIIASLIARFVSPQKGHVVVSIILGILAFALSFSFPLAFIIGPTILFWLIAIPTAVIGILYGRKARCKLGTWLSGLGLFINLPVFIILIILSRCAG